MNQNTKSVIITGALGFIGGHTAKAFKRAGYHVIGVDRAWTIPNGAFFIDQLFVDDFVNMVPAIVENNNVEAIIHIAGTSLVGPSIKNPGEYYDNNVSKTNIMLRDLADLSWQGKFIFSSSAAIYGNNCSVPIAETAEGIPVSPYGHSKKMCEYIINDHTRAYGHRSIALRYFNACGCDPEGRLGNVWEDSHLIPKIIQAAIKNKEITINGNDFATKDGTCIRDYLHVSDIANAHVKAVELADQFLDGTFKFYNLGTGQGFSNLEIAQSVEDITGIDIQIKFGQRRIGDPDELIADPSLFVKDTGWKFMHSDLATIISTTYNWMKKHEMAS